MTGKVINDAYVLKVMKDVLFWHRYARSLLARMAVN